MNVSVGQKKGGVGKTTTAMAVAAYLSQFGPTVLFDGDTNRSASNCVKRRDPARGDLPFRVEPVEMATRVAHEFEHKVIDTAQAPNDVELQAMVYSSDLVIVPTFPIWMEADGMVQTVKQLEAFGATNYRVLICKVAPNHLVRAEEMRAELAENGVPIFAGQVPRFTAFEKASGLGLTLAEVDDANAVRAWAAYCAIGEEIEL